MHAQVCEYAKDHWIVHLKWVNCMVLEFYLSKRIFKAAFGDNAFLPTLRK